MKSVPTGAAVVPTARARRFPRLCRCADAGVAFEATPPAPAFRRPDHVARRPAPARPEAAPHKKYLHDR